MIVASTRFGLLLFGYRAWKSLLSQISHAPVTRLAAALDPAESLVRMLDATAQRLPFRSTCLERSLGLWWMLIRRGYDAQVRIGARISAEGFEAHAWVERDGVILNDASGEYLSFSQFDKSLAALRTEAQ